MTRLTTWAPLFLRSGFAHVDNVITKRCSKQSHGCPWQGCNATNHTVTLRNLPNLASRTLPAHTRTLRNPPEPSGSCLRNPHQHTPELSGTFRNLPTPAEISGTFRNPPEPSGTYTSTHRMGTFRNLLLELTPAHTVTLRNLPEPASGTYTSTHRKSPEPSGTLRNPLEPTPAHTGWEPSGICFWNLHQHTPEPSGTFRNLPPQPTPAHIGTLRNLPPEPTPAHTGTLRNLPEPSSGTCSCDPHRHTPELIWAEDPISLRCWGKIQ